MSVHPRRRPQSRSQRRPPAAQPGALTGPEPSRAARLQNIREIASLVNAGSEIGTLFERTVLAVCQHTSWTRAGIMAADPTAGSSVLITRFEPRAENEADLPRQWELATSPTLKVVETKQPVVIPDAQTCGDFPGYRQDALARDYHTVVVLPLGCTDIQGREMVLSVSSDECVPVTSEELDFLLTVSHLAGIAVDKAKSLHGQQLLTRRLERAIEVNSSLLERVLQGASMPMIAGIVQAVVPDPLIIADLTTDTFLVGRSPDAIHFGDREWADLVRGPASEALLRDVQCSEPSDFRRLRRIDLTACGVPFERDAFVEPLQIDGQTAGGLIIFPRPNGLDELDRLIAMEVKFALSVQLMRTHVQQQSRDLQVAEVFTRLFEGSWRDPSQVQSRAARLGIDLSVPAQLLAIGLSAGAGASGKIAGHYATRRLGRVVQQFHAEAVAFEYAGTVFLYVPRPPAPELLGSTLGRQLIDAIKLEGAAAPIIAIGPLCTGPDQYQPAREHCLRILALAGSAGRQGLVQQHDFGPYAVLLASIDQNVADTFMAGTIGGIEAYDRQHGTELLRTASAFIDQGCRYQGTANVLQVHISTLRYRLQRIEEVFGLDLDNAETRFALALALRLRSVLDEAAV